MSPEPTTPTREELLHKRAGWTFHRVQGRIDACIERAGSRDVAVTGPGMGFGLLLMEEIASILRDISEAEPKQHLTSEPAGPTVAAGMIAAAERRELVAALRRVGVWALNAPGMTGLDCTVIERAAAALEPEPAASVPVTPEKFADAAVQWLCELPDRTSPEDWPEACLVTGEELHAYLVEHVSALLAASTGARRAVVEEIAKRHEADDAFKAGDFFSYMRHAGMQAHEDRAKLLALIGAKQP